MNDTNLLEAILAELKESNRLVREQIALSAPQFERTNAMNRLHDEFMAWKENQLKDHP